MITLGICFAIFVIGLILFKTNLKQKKKFAISALAIGLLSIIISTSVFVSEQLWVNSFIKYKQFCSEYGNISYLPEYRERALKFNEQLKNKRYDKALFGEWILVSNRVFELNKIPVHIPRK